MLINENVIYIHVYQNIQNIRQGGEGKPFYCFIV